MADASEPKAALASESKGMRWADFLATAPPDSSSEITDLLLIDGQHNPLTLLHSALSEGLHANTDAECLEIAQAIRVVLTELADRISQALKKEVELTTAVSRLLNRKSSKP